MLQFIWKMFLFGLVAPQTVVSWKVMHGMDNFGYDIRTASGSDVDSLKAECEATTYCAGFSSFYRTLKFNVSNATLGMQANTDLYVREPAPPPLPSPLSVPAWPMPKSVSSGQRRTSVTIDDADFKFFVSGQAPVLLTAAERYRKMLFPGRGEPAVVQVPQERAQRLLTGCVLQVDDLDADLRLGVDESFTLDVQDTGGNATIMAVTVWGALRGLETFSQLLEFSNHKALEAGLGTIHGVPLRISDEPRFTHRGLMLDSARHFLPVDLLLQHLDAMAAVKLNTLHWHLSDSQAFPLNSSAHPDLARLGSYDARRATYSHDDVRRVVSFARERGIRVVPEFDMPAHTDSWFQGYPELQGSLQGSIDPTREENYDFVDTLLAEVAGLFPDEAVHLGADELSLGSWNASSAIRSWMDDHGVETVAALEDYWLERVRSLSTGRGKRMMIWHDPLNNGANPKADTIVEVWGGDASFAHSIAAKGYDTVFAAPFYLDHMSEQWTDFYSVPFPPAADPTVESHMLGGEACMWGEWVDETNSFTRVWPRAAAVAELLWSSVEASDAFIGKLAAPRLAQWRCRMLLRGLPVEPVGSVGGGPFWCGPDAQSWTSTPQRGNGGAIFV